MNDVKEKIEYIIWSTNQIYIQTLRFRNPHERYDWYGSSTNQKSSFGLKSPKKRLKQYLFSEKQKCRLVVSLHVFLENIWKTRDWNGEFDSPADALSTPSSFHCCLSQDSITFICLSPLLVCCARVVLECSATESRKERAGKYTHSLFRFS